MGATGATGMKGSSGVSTFLQSSYGFDNGQTPVPLPPNTPIAVASTASGSTTSPARILEITATFACSSAQVPNTADFWLRIDGVDQVPPAAFPGGAELSFWSPGGGASGAICLRVPVSAGAHSIDLMAEASQPGAAVDPVGRPKKDHAAVMVNDVSV